MIQITYEMLQKTKRKIELNQELSGFELKISDFLKQSKKHSKILEEILKEEAVDEKTLGEYMDKISALINKLGFASVFLVKELPKEYIDTFDIKKWQAITKISNFTKLDYDSKRACLMLCGIFGIFEKDQNVHHRTESLKKILPNLTSEEIKKYSLFQMKYDPQFLSFFIQNRELLNQEQLTRIQSDWDEIKKVIETKSLENVLRFIEISSETQDTFERYMRANNIPEKFQKKYKAIYEQMAGRTKISIPSVSGKDTNSGYSYEILQLKDPRILRFGEDSLIKCCQKLGENGEGSMIYSAIESSARVIMVRDELGEPIAGSLITHQIGKDGRSHVCFDSIEVNANRARIKADEYKVTLKKIEKLKNKGILKTGSLEELQQYFKTNPPTKKRKLIHSKMYKFLEKSSYLFSGMGLRTLKKYIDYNNVEIGKDDLKALEVNKKILDVYRKSAEDMCIKDEQKRREQLQNGEITEDEYNHLLMKNGLFTVGKNPVSMYLGNLDELDKKSMEKLPTIQKSRSIYRKAHFGLNFKNILKSLSLATIDTISAFSLALTTLGLLGVPSIQPVSIGLTIFSLGAPFIAHGMANKNKIKGVYSDSLKEQRVLKDGREKDDITKEIVSEINKNKFKEKLFYNEAGVISNPTLISSLNQEEQKRLRRLAESFSKGEIFDLQDRNLIIGNLKNWAAVFSNDDGKLVLDKIFLSSPFSLGSNTKEYIDAQNDLIENIMKLAQSNEMICNCKDKKINKYLSNIIKKGTNKTNDVQSLGLETVL